MHRLLAEQGCIMSCELCLLWLPFCLPGFGLQLTATCEGASAKTCSNSRGLLSCTATLMLPEIGCVTADKPFHNLNCLQVASVSSWLQVVRMAPLLR